jgi:hypothetical protein
MAATTLTISKAEVDALPVGARCMNVNKTAVIVHKSANGDLRACLK